MPAHPFNVPDAIFPSEPQFGIAMLDVERQATFLDAPVHGWGGISRRSRMRGTWHFYTDDYKFANVWRNPDSVADTNAVGAVEVNYTLDDGTPRWRALQAIGQKRWLARYWQERGMRVWVDLNVPTAMLDDCMLGVPEGWRSYATRAISDDVDALQERALAGVYRAGGGTIRFMVYGGGNTVAKVCRDNDWIHVRTQATWATKPSGVWHG